MPKKCVNCKVKKPGKGLNDLCPDCFNELVLNSTPAEKEAQEKKIGIGIWLKDLPE